MSSKKSLPVSGPLAIGCPALWATTKGSTVSELIQRADREGRRVTVVIANKPLRGDTTPKAFLGKAQ